MDAFRRRQDVNSEPDFLGQELSLLHDSDVNPDLQTEMARYRRDFGSRFDDFYRTGLPVQGYPYNYETNPLNRSRSRFEMTTADDNRFLRKAEYERYRRTYQRGNSNHELWRITGPYTGRGPRNYHRTDEQIQEAICERLTQHGQVDASGIDVAVQRGEVYLTGTVDRKRERRIAEDLAYSVQGVRDVINRIRLNEKDAVRERRAGFENVVMPGRMQVGMNVYGSDGNFLGRVKLVREQDFLLARSMARDMYVPFSAVLRTNGEIVLRVTRDEIHTQNWEKPPLFGSFEKSGSS